MKIQGLPRLKSESIHKYFYFILRIGLKKKFVNVVYDKYFERILGYEK
jgi:hypothetical protein